MRISNSVSRDLKNVSGNMNPRGSTTKTNYRAELLIIVRSQNSKRNNRYRIIIVAAQQSKA